MRNYRQNDFDVTEADYELPASLQELAERSTLPSPYQLEFYRRISKREILLNIPIDDNAIDDITNYILKWNLEDRGVPVEKRVPAKLMINTLGGEVNVVMHLIDVINASKTPVITVGLSKCYSSGALLLMAGHKRYAFKNTCFLIHDGSSGIFGDTGKVLDSLEFTRDMEDRMKNHILSKSKISDEILRDNYRRNWFMFADEALKYGFIDEIIEDLDQIK